MKIKIAVSGVGGGVGQSIIKSLQNTDYEIVALDGAELGTGLYAAKKSYIIPYASDPTYIEKILEICKTEDCKLFFPGLDAELPVLSSNIDKFTEIGTTVIVSPKHVIDISDNKMLTYTELSKHGIKVPYTIDLENADINNEKINYPIILKEKEGGARSQNIYKVTSSNELEKLTQNEFNTSNYIAQEYIEGDEYTCGSINLGGKCMGVIVMRRILRDGDTYKCFSVRDMAIESQVKNLLDTIKPFGACNVQLRVRDGEVYVFEINARCSGTTAARTLCGFNEPKMIADYLCKNIEPNYTIKEQTILRYWKELVVDNETVDFIRKNKTIQADNPPKL